MAEQWYYSKDTGRQGPHSLDEVRKLYQSGQIRPETLVWNETLTDWQPAGRVSQISGGGADAPAAEGGLGTLSYSMPQMEPLVFTDRAMAMLRQTRPWARFISILIWISAALMIVVGVGMALVMLLGRISGGIDTIVFLVYPLLALLYIMPAVYLGRYASRIAQLDRLRRSDVLEATLEAQKSFWRFVGIVALTIIGLYVVIGVVAFIVAILA